MFVATCRTCLSCKWQGQNNIVQDHIKVTVPPEALIAGEGWGQDYHNSQQSRRQANKKSQGQNKFNNTSVRPHMNQTMPVACIDLIAIFIIEKSSNVFQGFSNCAPYSGVLLSLPWITATSWTVVTAVAFLCNGKAITCPYLRKTLTS